MPASWEISRGVGSVLFMDEVVLGGRWEELAGCWLPLGRRAEVRLAVRPW